MTSTPSTDSSARCELDHLVWAVPDLERGIDALEKHLGARALPGGRHPGVGTRNALLEIGDRRYLEILAPDPDQDSFRGFGLWVEDLRSPKLVTWAVRTHDLEAWCAAAEAAGLLPTRPAAMRRDRLSGESLEWRLAALGQTRRGLLPFAIEWGAAHPCDDLPESGCRLLELRLQHPEPRDIVGRLGDLGFDLQAATPGESRASVGPGPHQCTAIFDTPRGRVELG
ncbi:MAG: VOC family protein [Acidobacteriota bacterium]